MYKKCYFLKKRGPNEISGAIFEPAGFRLGLWKPSGVIFGSFLDHFWSFFDHFGATWALLLVYLGLGLGIR